MRKKSISPNPIESGKRLKTVRKENGFTQESLAFHSGYTKQHISNCENGKCGLSRECAEDLGELLKVSPDYLLCLCDEKTDLEKERLLHLHNFEYDQLIELLFPKNLICHGVKYDDVEDVHRESVEEWIIDDKERKDIYSCSIDIMKRIFDDIKLYADMRINHEIRTSCKQLELKRKHEFKVAQATQREKLLQCLKEIREKENKEPFIIDGDIDEDFFDDE